MVASYDHDGKFEIVIDRVPVILVFFCEISSFEQNTCSLLCNPSTQKFDSATDKFSFLPQEGHYPQRKLISADDASSLK